MSKQTTMTLSNAALFWLRLAIAQPTWPASNDEHYRAGKLLEKRLPQIKDQPKYVDPMAPTVKEVAALNEWEAKTVEFDEITGKSFEDCKKAVGALREAKRLPVGSPTNELLELFRMVDADC